MQHFEHSAERRIFKNTFLKSGKCTFSIVPTENGTQAILWFTYRTSCSERALRTLALVWSLPSDKLNGLALRTNYRCIAFVDFHASKWKTDCIALQKTKHSAGAPFAILIDVVAEARKHRFADFSGLLRRYLPIHTSSVSSTSNHLESGNWQLYL